MNPIFWPMSEVMLNLQDFCSCWNVLAENHFQCFCQTAAEPHKFELFKNNSMSFSALWAALWCLWKIWKMLVAKTETFTFSSGLQIIDGHWNVFSLQFSAIQRWPIIVHIYSLIKVNPPVSFNLYVIDPLCLIQHDTITFSNIWHFVIQILMCL